MDVPPKTNQSQLTNTDHSGVVYWFRNDLRLHDQPALAYAVRYALEKNTWLLPIYIHDTRLKALTPWGFERTGRRRASWTQMALQGLSTQIAGLGSRLLEVQGDPATLLGHVARALDGPLIVCEEIAAPEEQHQVETLQSQGLTLKTIWQSTLIDPEALPVPPQDLPDVFTAFRQLLEKSQVRATPPIESIRQLPRLPEIAMLSTLLPAWSESASVPITSLPEVDRRSAFPWDQPRFHGSEQAALAHIEQYCRRGLPHAYESTRNGLLGVDYSSKWSPWLATGALSPRTAWASIADFEASEGANKSTYWLFFELLWRDHFRWLHKKYGKKLYFPGGLKKLPPPSHDSLAFQRWCQANTGNPFIDAGMKELALTGYLSNRMRQNVASYLIHDLACDWRAGAAWFEANLIDYDVYSNQANWLYISGRGTDPRPQRRFNPELQAKNYDPGGSYRKNWLES